MALLHCSAIHHPPGMAAATRKRRSAAVSPAANSLAAPAGESDANDAGGKKKRKVATSVAPLSAVARRRLAAQQELEKQQQLQSEAESSISVPAAIPQDNADNASQNSDAQEDSDQEDDEDEEPDSEPVASTSKQPYPGLKVYDKAPKRYFLGGATSLDSSTAPSPAAEEDAEASILASEGEYIQAGDVSRAESTSYTKRPSRRRRRAENAANFYVDPTCASTLQPTSENSKRYVSQDGVTELVIGLYPGETIVLRGCCSLKVLQGNVKIDCATLTSASNALPIFAPSTHALPAIRAVRSSSTTESPWPYTESNKLEQPILIALRSIQAGVEGIEAICRLAGMPIPSGGMWQLANRWSSASEESKDTYKILLESERDHCATVVPHNWVEALESVESASPRDSGLPNPAYLIQGPKGVGKSTFGKLLINTLLSRYTTVAYLDCDLGQPEFTPSGFLSLSLVKEAVVGPSFTHLNRRPTRMHYLGSATPKDDPAFYLWAISDLVDHYSTLTDEDGNPRPLVVNTQGWYKGLGADLLLEIHRMTRPSQCFDFAGGIHPNAGLEAFAAGASIAIVDPALDSEVHPMQPYITPENGPPRLNASDLRMIQFISYFHLSPACLSSTPAIPTWDFSTSLIARPPYAVPISTFKSIKMAVSDTVDFVDLLKALDVSIVALRAEEIPEDTDVAPIGAGETERLIDSALRKAFAQGSAQGPSDLVGLGIIRSIDVKAQVFHILTPLPAKQLEQVNAITKGDIEIPTVLMVNYAADQGAEESGLAGVEWKMVPYLEYGENTNAGVGHGRRRVRRNVMRRSQFK